MLEGGGEGVERGWVELMVKRWGGGQVKFKRVVSLVVHFES